MNDVINLIDEVGRSAGYICKGHVSLDDFIAGIELCDGTKRSRAEIGDGLEHTTMRCVPVPSNSDVAYSTEYVPSKPGRGAFKATIWDGVSRDK